MSMNTNTNQTQKMEQGRFMRILSSLTDRMKFAAQLGMQFGGKRDLYSVFGYPQTLDYGALLGKYERDDIAGRIVDAPADGTWEGVPMLEGNSQLQKDWEVLVKEHQVYDALKRVDKLAGIGQYAVLLVGFDDGARLETDARSNAGTGRKVTYLQPYSQRNAHIIEIDKEPSSPRFGLPTMYELKTSDQSTTALTGTVPAKASVTHGTILPLKVHWTRVLHVAEGRLEDRIYGTPRLQRVYNRLEDLAKIAGGSAETFWLAGNRGLQVDVDKELELSPEDAAALSEEIDEYQHNLRRVMRTRGVKVNPLGSDVPNPKGAFEIVIALISGATGIPQRILLGSEAGHLASDQDRANWADRIDERRETFAEPHVLVPLIRMLSEVGVLRVAKMTEIDFKWPPAYKLTPKEKDESKKSLANAANALARQSTTGGITTIEEAREMLGLPPKPPAGQKLIERVEQQPAFGNPGSGSRSAPPPARR